MNYAALSAAIESYTQSNDPTFLATIDRFIQLAERRIYMEAKLPANRKNSTGVTVLGNRSLTLPLDYITGKAISITTAAGTYNLLPKAAEFLDEMYPVVATQAQPKFYAQYDTLTLMLAPTPDAAYPVQFHYNAVPSSIVQAQTTWLGDNYEQVLLYGALLEAYVFLKGDEKIMASYKALYDIGMQELKQVSSETVMANFR